MGVDFRRPPLPAPTESMDENSSTVDTEIATNLTTRTDKTSYEIPEDGSPITITTQKLDNGRMGHHSRQKSQTSLLIEYFETSKSGDKGRSRPSVRVKVTPSSKKGRAGASDAVQITSIGSDRKPSYTRRISLGNKGAESVATSHHEQTEISHSSGSNLSGRPPVEIEVLNDGSDISNHRSSRGLMYAPIDSNVSSMPPDSLLESEVTEHADASHEDDSLATIKDTSYLKAPVRTRSRSTSRERLTQRVMEKLGANPKQRRTVRGAEHESRRRRASKSHDEEIIAGGDSSVASSNLTTSQRSYRSGASQASRITTNNPKLLEMVEDAITRMILPQINALKENQRAEHKAREIEGEHRTSSSRSEYEHTTLERRRSASTSSLNMASRPKVVLNREGDDPGTVLSRGDSARVRSRKSKGENVEERSSSRRRSSGHHSRSASYSEERLTEHRKRSDHGLRDAAIAGVAGGVLTAAALKHHDSQNDIRERRRERSVSHGSKSHEHNYLETREAIPPMPLASQINESEMTRDSILSHATDRPRSVASGRTPVREVSRGSLGDLKARNQTPTRSPVSVSRRLINSQSNHSLGSPRGSPGAGVSNKTRVAQLAGAVAAGAVAAKTVQNHVDADGYGETRSLRKSASPAHSVSSLRKTFEEADQSLIPSGLRPQSAASRLSAREHGVGSNSGTSLRSGESSPTTAKVVRSLEQSQDLSMDEFATPNERPLGEFERAQSSTPMDEWFERQHEINDRYRDSIAQSTNRDSYQTNPYPQDERRFTMMTTDSTDVPYGADVEADRDVKPVGANPEYIHTPLGVESAVASLLEPSFVSSNIVSSTGSPTKERGSYSDRMAEQLKTLNKDSPPALYQGSTLSQNMSSEDRWAGLSRHARGLSASNDSFTMQRSPRQSPAKSLREHETIEEEEVKEPKMVASGIPLADDPLPEIGHFDDTKSELSTNPSIIKGPLGGDETGNSTWPYTPEPQRDYIDAGTRVDHRANSSDRRKVEDVLAAAAIGGGAAALLAAHKKSHDADVANTNSLGIEFSGEKQAMQQAQQPTIERDLTPIRSPHGGDEGYVTDQFARSGGGATPKDLRFSAQDNQAEYDRMMNEPDYAEDDPFVARKHPIRQVSGGSHGRDSPLYDSATGRGVENIQSKDVVALMDHLTVRDAQRNARDTEILVTLVRNAAEMKQSFDEMKRFIIEQDKMIMQNTDRVGDRTAQKVLGGPRPQPPNSRDSSRRGMPSEEDVQTKRRGVLRRALKGLTGGKSASDLARIEAMLMQVLDNVEDLKHQGSVQAPTSAYSHESSADSYERLRAAPDPGYEPEGQAGTESNASHSGNFTPITPREKQQFHSGYDGRPGSANRVSTVHEDDEDELEPQEIAVLDNQFENNERMLTPTQDRHRYAQQAQSQPRTSYETPDKQKKHKSTSSIFGIPKISRWSKTTSSSAAPDAASLDSPEQARHARPSSEASRSMTDVEEYDDDMSSRAESRASRRQQHAHHAADGQRSVRSQASRLTRTPSPLIPSEASSMQHDEYDDYEQEDDLGPEFDDPKYQAHRNSLLLQHPQPRQGDTTRRHPNALENQAHSYDDPTGTNSDISQRSSDFDPAIWGSSATAGLARHRLSHADPSSSPAYGTSNKRASTDSKSSRLREQNQNQSLIPEPAAGSSSNARQNNSRAKTNAKDRYYDQEMEDEYEEPQFSNSGFSKGGHYSSPYGSGHLLEPIEEVRYSLETDSGRITPEPKVAQAIDMRSPARRITGPRPMGSVSPAVKNAQAQVVDTGSRRRAVGGGNNGSSDSFDSDIF